MNVSIGYGDTKRYILTFLLVVSAVFALFENYFTTIIDLPENWYISAIFVALIFIVEMITDVNKLNDRFERVIEESGWSRVKLFPTYDDFYKDLSKAVDQAQKSLYLTHVRDESPEDFDAESTRNYFNKLEVWCNNHPSGQVKRVTTLSNERMIQWGGELKKRTNSIQNFYVRVCDWSQNFPFINLAIIDEEMVFIALTSDTAQETKGLVIKDSEVSKYFTSYFNNMWLKSNKLDKELPKDSH